jgi:hypothetical protein
MNTTQKCAVALTLLVLAGCENEATRRQPIPVVLADKGEPVTLHIPRGYIEEPKKPEGVLPNVILRIAAQDFSGATAFAPESEVRVLIEPTASAVDAAHKLQAAALLKHKSSEEALAKSAELSKPGLIAYTYPNANVSEDAKAYYLKSKSGDVFVECRRSVCKAFKTWKKRVHLRFDYQPVQTADVEQVDAAVDSMLQSFAPEANTAR